MEFIRYVPKAYLSYLVGKLANLPVPWPLNEISIRICARAYGIDPSSATEPVTKFNSVGHFFTRDLKPELRPIGDGFVSPVDGRLRSIEVIPSDGYLTQTKGRRYSAAQLLGDETLAKKFSGGMCFNFYLSPTDAHHIFAPCAGHIIQTKHIPGKLWPVNNWAFSSVESLFAVNERVVSLIESGDELVAVIMVGATNVGRIEVKYTDILTNTAPWRTQSPRTIDHSRPIPLAKGEKIGTFHMGSSVLVLTQRERPLVKSFIPDAPVRYGESMMVGVSC